MSVNSPRTTPKVAIKLLLSLAIFLAHGRPLHLAFLLLLCHPVRRAVPDLVRQRFYLLLCPW